MNRFFWIVLVLVIIFSIWAFFSGREEIGGGVRDWVADQEKLAAEDIYGGKAPEETLRLFAEALEAGDVERAAKYFILQDDGTRSDWEKGLAQAKSEGRLAEIVDAVKRARPNADDSTHLGDFKFVVLDDAGAVAHTIDMELNQATSVWKIESL